MSWRSRQVLLALAGLLACAEHGDDVAAGSPTAGAEPRTSRRALTKTLPRATTAKRVHALALAGTLWIDPFGRRATLWTDAGESLELDALTPEHAGLHGRALRIDGDAWRCEGRWFLAPTELSEIGETSTARRPGGGVPSYPLVSTAAQLRGLNERTSPWVLVTGEVTGHWEEGWDGGSGEAAASSGRDGARVRLADGLELQVRDPYRRPLRRALAGDRVTLLLERASISLEEVLEPLGVCAGETRWCAADVLSYPMYGGARPEHCTSVEPSAPRAGLAGAAAPMIPAPSAPTRGPMPPFACQRPNKLAGARCSQ